MELSLDALSDSDVRKSTQILDFSYSFLIRQCHISQFPLSTVVLHFPEFCRSRFVCMIGSQQ